ncbi:10748_t:CDS:2 [Paraglomus occultum]|uniref:10748_t:CDS:1 n=1 Tax=Paraglomus occultum TaxID=144539 RepID=A0A9N8VRE9_9GLOM|nr:10748_t:CDS:2 [Paraglomus occultum]
MSLHDSPPPSPTLPAYTSSFKFSRVLMRLPRISLSKCLIAFFYHLMLFCICLIPILVMVTIIKYKMIPDQYDYSQVTFDWKIDPRGYLIPMNGSIGTHNDSGGVEILLDGHVHTTRSDGKLSPEQVIQWGIANGYNAMIVSDHNTIKGGLEAKEIAETKYNDSIIIIPAVEYSNCRIHMNLIGLTQDIPYGSAEPSDDEIKQIIDLTHELGGLVSVNHIPWSNKTESGYEVATLPNHPTREQLVEWGVDAFELINGGTFDMQTYLYVSSLSHSPPLFFLSGTDLHYPNTPAYAWTLLSTPSFTSESLFTTLRSRPSTSFLFDPAGTRFISYPPERSSYYALLPLMELADYWTSFYEESRGMYSFMGSFCHERKMYYVKTVEKKEYVVVERVVTDRRIIDKEDGMGREALRKLAELNVYYALARLLSSSPTTIAFSKLAPQFAVSSPAYPSSFNFFR